MTKSLNSESIIEQREDVEETNNNDAQRFVSHSNAEQDAELYAEPYAEPYVMPSIEPYAEQYNQEPQTSCNYQHTSNYAQDRVDIPVQEYDYSTYYGNQEPCYTKWVYPRPEEENPY